jgi:hypothetical protein
MTAPPTPDEMLAEQIVADVRKYVQNNGGLMEARTRRQMWLMLNENIAAALSTTAAQAEAWRPIETAPKDETIILVGNFRDSWSCFQHVVYWNDTDLGTPEHPWRITDTDQGIHKDYPTHWQPLPAPPSAAAILAQTTPPAAPADTEKE